MSPQYEAELRRLEARERAACNAVHQAHADFLDGTATAADLDRLGLAYMDANNDLAIHIMGATMTLAARDIGGILAGVKAPTGDAETFRAMGMATPREGKT